MPKKLLFCDNCKTYTLREMCRCGKKTHTPHPPKFSPVDKYQKYRIDLFKEKFEAKLSKNEIEANNKP